MTYYVLVYTDSLGNRYYYHRDNCNFTAYRKQEAYLFPTEFAAQVKVDSFSPGLSHKVTIERF